MAELPQGEFIFITVVGTLGILLFTGGFAIFIVIYQRRKLKDQYLQQQREQQYNQQMVQAQLESQENERKRIAADLHDSLGSLLWAAKVDAEFIERSARLRGEAKTSLHDLKETLDQCIQTTRRIAWDLTPEAFHHAGLSQSIKTLCNRLNGRGIAVHFEETGTPILWNDSRALLVFRIIQELVSNSLKHAQADNLNLILSWNQNSLDITVTDNGTGFTLQQQRSGLGWWNIHQRCAQLEGEISMGDTPMGKGSVISLIVPL
jgi:two-component system, NarL family, sensor kinase